MTKAELVRRIQAERAPGMSRREVARLIDVLFDEIGGAVLRSGRFTYPGFGTFDVRQRQPRRGRNPRTKELMRIEGKATVGFRPSPDFQKKLGE